MAQRTHLIQLTPAIIVSPLAHSLAHMQAPACARAYRQPAGRQSCVLCRQAQRPGAHTGSGLRPRSLAARRPHNARVVQASTAAQRTHLIQPAPTIMVSPLAHSPAHKQAKACARACWQPAGRQRCVLCRHAQRPKAHTGSGLRPRAPAARQPRNARGVQASTAARRTHLFQLHPR